MADLLQEAYSAKENGDLALAKQLISQALVQQPRNEAAWMLMADVVDDVKLRRNCLERVVSINPNNTVAQEALSKLNTSPLTPISRGERDKPLNPPQLEKIPPFTPPFTWEGDHDEFLALGDMTYPDLPGEKPNEPPDAIPTFDWASESKEPDKTIQKIFDAVSNPDLASQPLPDTDLSWRDTSDQPDSPETQEPTSEAEYDARLLDQLVGPEEELTTPEEQQPTEVIDFTVSAEPQMGLDAFTTSDQALETITSDYRMWDNPKLKVDRMVILSNKSLVYASPKESDVPHIQGLFAENRMLRDLLGNDAGTIKLEGIQSLTANPRLCTLSVLYRELDKKKKKKPVTHTLKFANAQVLDEVFEALKVRLGAGYTRSTRTFSMAEKIVPPLITLLLIAFVGWGLIAGLVLLADLPAAQAGFLQALTFALQDLVTLVGKLNIFIATLVLALLVLIWLLTNLRQPGKLIILER